MEMNFKDILETIELNKEDLAEDRIMMNELVVDDIMQGLGYNKRKNKSVKRITAGIIDWAVSEDEVNKLAVRTYPLNESVDESMIKQTAPFCKNNNYQIILYTNGLNYSIYRLADDEYKEITSFNIETPVDDANKKLLEAISKDGYNLELIDEVSSKVTVTDVIVKDIINNRKNDIIELIASDIKKDDADVISDTTDIVNNIFDFDNKDKTTITYAELDELKNSIESKKSEIEELRKTIDSNNNTINELTEKLDAFKDSENTINELTTTLELRDAEIDSLKEQIENSGNTEGIQNTEELIKKEADIKDLTAKLEAKDASLIDANREIVNLKEELANVKDTSSKTDTDIINSYVKQIQDLTNQLGQEKDVTKQLSEELRQTEEKLNGLTGVEEQKAKDLLAVIEDDPNLPRQYVAVINTELMQYDGLTKFIGQVMQKLFEIKKLEASQFIFDGDLFKLNSNAVRRDVVLGSKSYDIELGDMDETEALNKLRIVFSHFDDIVFQCKKIGSLNKDDGKPVVKDEIEVDEDESTDIKEETAEVKLDDDMLEGSEGLIAIEEQVEEQGSTAESLDYLIVSQLEAVDDILYTDEDVTFNKIVYIGNNDITFNINKDRADISLEQVITKCVDAGLSMAESNDKIDIVQLLKQTDLSNINDTLHLYTDEYKGMPRINGTKYVVAGVADIKQATQVIVDIFKALDILTDDVFIYYTVNTSSEKIKQYSFEEEAVQMRNDPFFEVSEDDPSALAVVKADMFNKITITMKSLQAHRDIIKRVIAVKTRYLEKKIQKYDDLVEVVESILLEAAKQNITVSFPSFGNVLGSTSTKLISDNAADVGDDPIELNVMNNKIYMARIEEWQIIASLVKMQNEVFKDPAMAIQCILDDKAITYYNEEYNTSESTLSLAVKSFAKYANSSVRKRN